MSTDAAPKPPPGTDAKAISPAYLAFLGDAVYTLQIRWRLMETGGPVSRAHALCARYVCAEAQANAFTHIEPLLTPEEAEIFRRGRNIHTHKAPKGASVAQYHAATGLEALVGYLYLGGRHERLETLFARIWAAGRENE